MMIKPYYLGLYEKSMPNDLTIPEKLEVVKQSGFDYLELSIDETEEKLSRLDWTLKETASLVVEMERIGVPIRSICLSGHRKYPLGHLDPAVGERSLEIMEKAIVLASRIGIRLIQLAGYDVYYESGNDETRENFRINLRKSVDMAASMGVTLAFETMETPFLNTVEKGMYWVREMNSPYLQLYPDTGNITNAALEAPWDAVADLQTGCGHVAAIHLKESRPGIYREVPYGAGHVDFLSLIQEGHRQNVGMYLAEFWYVGQTDWQNTICQNNTFLRKMLDTVYGN